MAAVRMLRANAMCGMIGCAAMIAAAALVPGLIGAWLISDIAPGERIAVALVPAALAFFAALVLFARDHMQQVQTIRRVRARLLARSDSRDDEFGQCFPIVDPTLMQQTRRAIASFFDVPVEKIDASISLRRDLESAALEPGFHTFVVFHVLRARNVIPEAFSFCGDGVENRGQLAAEIERVLDQERSARDTKAGGSSA